MIRVYIGISGSGKTTKAIEDVSNDLNGIRINRDDLRMSLFGLDLVDYKNYFSSDDMWSKEKIVTSVQEAIIKQAIKDGKNVYADNTHLKQQYIKKYYQYGDDVELIWVDAELKDCIERDALRDRTVGEEVIKKQYDSYQILKKNWNGYEPPKIDEIKNDPDNQPAVVFDIDGTLAKMEDRSPFDWDRVDEDLPNYPVWKALWNYWDEGGYKVIICTGRDGVAFSKTKSWLNRYSVPYHQIYIREPNDNRPDWQVKEEFWRDICKEHWIEAMYDDRNQVVDHARKLGFTVFQVDYGDF